jgi:hypothetical protein
MDWIPVFFATEPAPPEIDAAMELTMTTRPHIFITVFLMITIVSVLPNNLPIN